MLQTIRYANWPYPKMCAHRGAGKLAPENTLEAIKYGASFGYAMFEFDVKLSRDEILFLLHDDTLDRTTDGTGIAAQFSMAELEQFDAGRPQLADRSSFEFPLHKPLRLPRFADIAAWLLSKGLLANVEIKPTPGAEAQTGAAVAKACWKIWNEFNGTVSIPPLLSSFSETALAAARDAVPELPRALLLHALPEDWLTRCQRLGVVALDANFRVLTTDVIATAHANQLRVVSYTINERSELERLRNLGLDCAITDEVDLFVPA